MAVSTYAIFGTLAVVLLVLFISAWDTLEYTEIGLDYNSLLRSINKEAFSPGRYYLGIGHSFLKFPSTVQNVQFGKKTGRVLLTGDRRGGHEGGRHDRQGEEMPEEDRVPEEPDHRGGVEDRGVSAPDSAPLRSRTKDGLEITLEVSFQYQLRPGKLWEL